MSPSFDPYHKWLGIPAHESPPNHYRLLGLSLFESDPDVIQHAIDQRMAHLKSLATGPRVALSERLLNEVAKAGVCLLRPAEKQAYDTALRAAMGAAGAGATTQPVVPPPPFVLAGQAGSPPGEVEFGSQFGPLEDVLSAAARENRNRQTWRRSSKRTTTFVAGMMLAGAIGVAAACLLLFLVNPKHPMVERVVDIFRSPDKVAKQTPPAPSPDKPPKTEDRRPPPPAQLAKAQKPEERRLPSLPAPPDTAPKPEGRRLPWTPSQPETLVKPAEPQPSPDAGRSREAAKAAPPTPPVSRTKVVLDLSQPVTHATLSEPADGGKAEIHVEDVKGLNTSYELKPSEGVLRLGQRVEIVLKDYNGLRIGLSLHARDSMIVDIAPKMGTIAFTQRWAMQAAIKAKKDVEQASQQLAAAKTEAQTIDLWLKSPGPKPLALRNANREQLLVLNQQTIPALAKDLKDLQAAADASQRLSQLAEQIHLTASIHFVVRSEAKEAGP